MIYEFQSSIKALIINLKIEYILMPWKLKIDFKDEILEVKQRNWFLIGYKANSVSLRFIKSINIQQYVIGSSIYIKTMGQNLEVKFLEKEDAEKIKEILFNFNRGKAKQIIIA